MAGRKTKYTPERVKVIIDGIQSGLTQKDACLIAGIDEDTLINWRNRHSDFSDQMTQAQAARSRVWLDGIAAQAPKDWRAYAELLDRCAPEYRKTHNVALGGVDGDAVVRFEIVPSRSREGTADDRDT